MAEIWMPVSGYEGMYEVSNAGRVKSLERIVPTFNANAGKTVSLKRKEKILAQSLTLAGYLSVCLCRNGKTSTKAVAPLVCAAFHGVRASGMQACHNDGVKTNNSILNLRWDTASANQSDRVIHGTDCKGEKVGTSKFTREQVLQIKSGMTVCDAQISFGISRTQFYRIKRGEAWSHVEFSEYPACEAA